MTLSKLIVGTMVFPFAVGSLVGDLDRTDHLVEGDEITIEFKVSDRGGERPPNPPVEESNKPELGPAPVEDLRILGMPIYRVPDPDNIGDLTPFRAHDDELYAYTMCEAMLLRLLCEERPAAQDSVPVEQIELAVEEAVLTAQVSPSPVFWQPDSSEVLVNVDTIFYTEADAQNIAGDILGYEVTIRVEPDRYVWSFGDGTILETTDVGAKYPEQSIMHNYGAAGEYSISLQTYWSASFRIEGITDWRLVTGEPVTVNEAGSISVVTKETRLEVAD